MFKKISILLLLSTVSSISTVLRAECEAIECLSMKEGSQDVTRKCNKCKSFCCLSVNGNASIGGTLTVGGNVVNNLFAPQTYASFYTTAQLLFTTVPSVIPFDSPGPSSGSGITNNNGSIRLAAIGTYEVTWQAEVIQSPDESINNQFALFLDGNQINSTVIGQSNTFFPVVIGGTFLITTAAANSVLTLELITNPTNITINSIANDVATITIRRLS